MDSDVQRVMERILKDAQEEAESIVHEAEEWKQTVLEKQREASRKKAMKETRFIEESTRNRVRAIRETVFAEAKRKADWLILAEKEQALKDVFDEVKRRLRDRKRSEGYIPVLEKLIVDAGVALGGSIEVLLSSDDANLHLNLDELEKTITQRTGVKTQLRLSPRRIQTSGGTLLRRVDGKIEVDNTFEGILDRSQGNLKLKIAKILFK